MNTVATTRPALRKGDMVTVGDSPSLWVVRDFFLRAGVGEMVEVAPLGGGCKMTARIENLRRNGEVAR